MSLLDNGGLGVDDARIPECLRAVAQWVVWRLEIRVDALGKPKPTKVPYDSASGRKASVTDATQWAAFDLAHKAWSEGGFDGVGFVFTVDDPFAGIDLDKCRDVESGEIEPWAHAIIGRLDSYTELSPSGTGVHVIVRGRLPVGRRRKDRVEMYDRGRFFCVTGQHLEGTRAEIEARDEELAALHTETFAAGEADQPASSNGATEEPTRTATLDDATLLARARAATNGEAFAQLYDRGDWAANYSSQSEADMALCSSLAFWTNRDAAAVDRLFRASKLFRPKWTELHGEQTYGAITVAKAVSGVKDGYQPTIRLESTRQVNAKAAETSEPPADDFLRASRTFRELMLDDTPEPPSIMGDGILRPRQVGQIHGPDGSRKSWEMLHLSIDLTVGRSHWGISVREGGVRCGIISLEDDLWTLKERLSAIVHFTGADLDLVERNLRVVCPPYFDRALDLTKPHDRDQVRDWVLQNELELVCIDHLSRAHALPDERDLRPVSEAALSIARECTCAILFSHHDRKGLPGKNRGDDAGASRGDSRFSADCRLKISMMEKGDRIRLLFEKSTRRKKPDPVWLKQHPTLGILEQTEAPAERAELIKAAAARRQQMDQLIQAAGPAGISPAELATALEVNEKTIQNYARKNKMIVRTGKAQLTRYTFPSNYQVMDPVRNEPGPSGPIPDVV